MRRHANYTARRLLVQVCAAATENILLAAEAIGLGAVWTGVYLDEKMENDVRDVLGIPKKIIPFNIIPIGWPTGEDKPKDKLSLIRFTGRNGEKIRQKAEARRHKAEARRQKKMSEPLIFMKKQQERASVCSC